MKPKPLQQRFLRSLHASLYSIRLSALSCRLSHLARLRYPGVLSVLLLTACSGPYEVTLNDQLVYDPFQRKQNYILDDANLQGCLNQHLNGDEATDQLTAITLMACPASGITSLRGIASLAQLEQLELSNNAITDLGPIAQLDRLRVLSIRNNDIRDIRPLLGQQLLRFVSLQGNSNIPCRQLDDLEERIGAGLGRPATCTN